MQIRMQVNDADVVDALRLYVERRLRFALSRFAERVGQITVRIGPNGRLGSHCRVSAEVLPFGQLRVDQIDSDLFTAIDRAIGKIRRRFRRELERIRSSRVRRGSIRLAASAMRNLYP